MSGGEPDWFCANPACELHVRPGDPGVHGAGEWAVRADGVVTSRRPYGGRWLCDLCCRRQDDGVNVAAATDVRRAG